MEGAVWDLEAEPPSSEANEGVGAKPPAAGGQWGCGGEAPQPPEARGFGGGAPSARKFCIFLQNNFILGLF